MNWREMNSGNRNARQLSESKDRLKELKDTLAKIYDFDDSRIWIGYTSYGTFEIDIDDEVWSNDLTYVEAESEIRSIFKGIELATEE